MGTINHGNVEIKGSGTFLVLCSNGILSGWHDFSKLTRYHTLCHIEFRPKGERRSNSPTLNLLIASKTNRLNQIENNNGETRECCSWVPLRG